jgi:hypothetical protein
MLKGLRGLVSKMAPEPEVKRTRKHVAKSANGIADYRAVLVAPGRHCCAAVQRLSAKRFLFREVPRLPLLNCTMAPDCSCKFKKASDRRAADRRQSADTGPDRAISAPEHRKGARRGSTKT